MSGTLPARLRCTTMTSMEATAHHEAGHVFMALYLGARVHSVTIEPDRDDGPDRFGDTRVEWDRGWPAQNCIPESPCHGEIWSGFCSSLACRVPIRARPGGIGFRTLRRQTPAVLS
ncbi:MAG: hypothetical protein NTY19_39835, partial [Planctomycetota bacterium]|nr:hypothetical protein [Planctomycetota bacterium]